MLYRTRDVRHEIWDVEGWREDIPSEEEVNSMELVSDADAQRLMDS